MPFRTTNQKVELADGEMYSLRGNLYFDAANNTMFLRVDLEETPWLANSLRKKFPFYPITKYNRTWLNLLNKPVTILVKANGKLFSNQQGDLSYGMFLEPYSSPLVVGN